MGAVFSIEHRGWRAMAGTGIPLLEFCSVAGALPIDAEAVYDPRLTNDRLLLGMKGTISEMEAASFRERVARGAAAEGTAGRLGSTGPDRVLPSRMA